MAILVSPLAVFASCHGVKWVPNVWELQQTNQMKDDEASMGQVMIWPIWVEYLTHTSHLLTTFSCSVNFYIYLLKVNIIESSNCLFFLNPQTPDKTTHQPLSTTI